MTSRHRLTIRSIEPDPRAVALATAARQLGINLEHPDQVAVADIIFFEGEIDQDDLNRLHGFLVDPLLQRGSWAVPTVAGVEITLLPGVTDNEATVMSLAAERLGIAVDGVATGQRVEFGEAVSEQRATSLVKRLVANPIIERWQAGTIEPTFHVRAESGHAVERIAVAGLDSDQLAQLGTSRSLALDPEELAAISSHFEQLGREITDVEIETLAQTWSEHCAHKTFRAQLECDDGDERPPLIDMLRTITDAIDADFVVSAFDGNAGIVRFADDITIALKAETHNHPSAVEPFGGANTGVGGVIRDVLGVGHRPVAITDILCFGHPDTPPERVPDGSLHPQRVREGVIDGVADYGNKIGLPTVAGAVLYDSGFTTNPLVFAGCIGVADEWTPPPGPSAGDRVVVVGGRTGRDGIRGATFSSLTMDASTGEVAGASVQIGDPIVEKLLIDALIGAEDLYSDITDCGAGGLSSAVGEMAEGVGATIDLDRVPLKYPGLAPWEIWLSEAQERMVLAVPPDNLDEFRDRCDYFGVEVTDLGEFTGDGRLVVTAGGDTVLDLSTEFLHDGRPQRQMVAEMPHPDRGDYVSRDIDDHRLALLRLLSHRNISSKAGVVHRYDHEILGATVARPLVGRVGDSPGDGVILAEPGDDRGLAVGIGVNPWYGLYDPEAMAYVCVDEAIRNVVAVGADPSRVALLDNFSWGDPRRASTLGDLVAAVDGICSAAMSFQAPFVSGKDSLNNEYTGIDGNQHAVPPTLVITAVADMPHADAALSSALTAAGNTLVLLGTTNAEFAGSHLDLVYGIPDDPGTVPAPDPDAADRYRHLHEAIGAGLVASCHDLSEGGLAVSLAEMCIGGRLGARIDDLPLDDLTASLFSESSGRLLCEIAPANVERFCNMIEHQYLVIGEVVDDAELSLPGLEPIPVGELADVFNRLVVPMPVDDDEHDPGADPTPLGTEAGAIPTEESM